MNVINTERLILRPFKENDAEAMYKNWTFDERVAKYCRWHPHENIDITKELLKMYLNEAEQGFEYNWAIVLNGTDEPIGTIGVIETDEERKAAEIGYVLSYSHWNKGYATEALKAVIDTLFCKGFAVIEADCHVDNPASCRVMEKCGMSFLRNDKEAVKSDSDELCDVIWYQITK